MLFKLAWRHLRGRAWEVTAVIVLQMAATIAALELPGLVVLHYPDVHPTRGKGARGTIVGG